MSITGLFSHCIYNLHGYSLLWDSGQIGMWEMGLLKAQRLSCRALRFIKKLRSRVKEFHMPQFQCVCFSPTHPSSSWIPAECPQFNSNLMLSKWTHHQIPHVKGSKVLQDSSHPRFKMALSNQSHTVRNSTFLMYSWFLEGISLIVLEPV